MLLIIGLVLFIGVHFTRSLAPNLRAQFIETRGDGAWKGLYSVISIVGFGLIIWGWNDARSNAALLYVAPDGLKVITYLGMLVSLILIVSNDLPTSHIKTTVRHPMTWAVFIWSACHLLVNGDSASVTLFGVFLVWSFFALFSMYRREPVTSAKEPQWKNDAIVVGVGLVVYIVLIVFAHEWLFGVSPVT